MRKTTEKKKLVDNLNEVKNKKKNIERCWGDVLFNVQMCTENIKKFHM